MTFLELALAAAGLAVLLELVTRIGPSQPPAPPPPPPTPYKLWRSFDWTFSDGVTRHDLSCRIGIRGEVYESAKGRLLDTRPSKTRMHSEDECFEVASQQITDPEAGDGSSEVSQVLEYLSTVANEKAFSNYLLANLLLSFVHEQCVPYSYDKDSTGHPEYFRFPLETIVDKTGDCDCKAILGCALYRAAGYRVAFALLPGHAALAISTDDSLPFANWEFNGRRWYYCEATGDSWQAGAIPPGTTSGEVEMREILARVQDGR